jgi:hypothetical protein
MWANFDGKAYTRAEFAAHVADLRWTDWKPSGVTLHNTAGPTLAQWAESGPNHDARIRNLESYYEQQLGWHSGPHLFISRNFINGFANILLPGVHASCFNRTHIGVEMVGDFNAEEFESGDGALVRDNAIFAVATLMKKLGLDPKTDLNFHVQCAHDNHDCPGKKVNRPLMIQRVAAAMGGDIARSITSAPPAPAPLPGDPTVRAYQTKLADLGFYKSPFDGDRGPLTNAALEAFAISELTKA